MEDGFNLDFFRSYSCDSAQPPQHAHQYINQGVHDYGVLNGLLMMLGMDWVSLEAFGLEWE